MSVVGIQRLAWDLEHVDGLLESMRAGPDDVLARYPLTATEALAVKRLDAPWLLRAGVNPVALRNLLVIQGVAHKDMYKERDMYKDMYKAGPGGEQHDSTLRGNGAAGQR
jgi:hypothetical protein